jgi:large subunit ribosomal protein L23
MAELHDILVRPIVTEKSARLAMAENVYVFEVGHDVNKIQIKRAVETFFDVGVENVRTLIVRGKTKRFGRHNGKRSNWKKAYVRLNQEDSLPFFDA